jgi:hypothetical protein
MLTIGLLKRMGPSSPAPPACDVLCSFFATDFVHLLLPAPQKKGKKKNRRRSTNIKAKMGHNKSRSSYWSYFDKTFNLCTFSCA